jgi:hypothetical protein
LADECLELLLDDSSYEDRRKYDAAMLAWDLRIAYHLAYALEIEIPF